MKLSKILLSTISLIAVIAPNANAVERVKNQVVYKEDFDPYQHPRSLTDFKERERLRKEAEARAAAQPPMQSIENLAPNPNEIYSNTSLQMKRPVNLYGNGSMASMQGRYMSTPVMTPQMAMQPAMPMAPAYRGELTPQELEENGDLFFSGVTLTPKVGTQGIGLELGTALNKYIGARIAGNYATYGESDTINNIEYDYDLNIANANALIDVHPFANGFRMTGGAYFQPDKIDFKATPANSVSVGGTTYTPSEVGTIDGSVETGDISPYGGIGFSRAFTRSGSWFFDGDLGVKVNDISSEVTSNGSLASDPTFQADLAREKQKVQENFDKLELYPVANIGFGYKF